MEKRSKNLSFGKSDIKQSKTMRIRYIIFLFSVFFCGMLPAQTAFKKDIVGTWELKRIKTEAIEIQKDSVKPEEAPFLKKDVILSFVDDHQLEMRVGEFSLFADYTLVDDQLTLGKFTFRILKMDAYKMILQHVNTVYRRTYIYHRISEKE